MKYVCNVCGYVYDEEVGEVENGIPAVTRRLRLPTLWRR